jgi:hypothetical protein
MKTLTELARRYEAWAKDSQALADAILASVEDAEIETRKRKLDRANVLLADAANLRQQAALLRWQDSHRKDGPHREIRPA